MLELYLKIIPAIYGGVARKIPKNSKLTADCQICITPEKIKSGVMHVSGDFRANASGWSFTP
jgi:hypothetical protein